MFRLKNLPYFRLFLLLAAAVTSFLPPAAPGRESAGISSADPLQLRALRYESAGAAGDKSLRIIAVFNRRPDYGLMVLDNPPRLVVNLPATRFSFTETAIEPPALLRHLRFGANGAGAARLIFTLRRPFRPHILESEAIIAAGAAPAWQTSWEIEPVEAEAFRQYLGLQQADFSAALGLSRETGAGRPSAEQKPAAALPLKNTAGNKAAPFIIVLDPGHGDFDSGAVGIHNTQEKQVTLAFAQALYRRLQDKAGIKPYLTREDDRFLRLGDRVEKARRLAADLFISIHADHIAMPGLRGATVYTLSDKASDAMAGLLAEHENKADLLDGLPADEPPAVADILWDMTRQETRLFSEEFAHMTVAAFKSGQIALIKNPHRFAGFQVLKAGDMPSVLIELGYLSNSEDEKIIADPLWQNKTAQILADTIARYAWAHGKIGVKP